MNMQRTPIIIIGMEHSGTSYLAEKLHANGVNMAGPWGFIDSGHGEDRRLWDLNKREWDRRVYADKQRRHRVGRRTELTRKWFHKMPSDKFMDELRDYYLDRLAVQAPGVPWGFKEPRISRLLPGYFDLFPEARYVCMLRNPYRIAITYEKMYDRFELPLSKLRKTQFVCDCVSWVTEVLCSVVDMRKDHNEAPPRWFQWTYDLKPEWMEVQNKALCEFMGVDLDFSDWRIT